SMPELSQAYADDRDFMDLTERMCQGLADSLTGSRQVVWQGITCDFGQAFRRVTVEDLIMHFNQGLDGSRLRDADYRGGVCAHLGIEARPGDGAGKLQIEIFERTA